MEQAAATTVPMQHYPAPAQSPYPGVMAPRPAVRRLKHRHQVFQLSVVGLVLAAVVFIVGFSAPAWADKTGLWMSCGSKYKHCYNNVGDGPGWLDAVRSMEVLALVCVVLSVAVELYQDVFKTPPSPDNKAVEILGVAAGVFGLIGVAVYGAELDDVWKEYNYYYDTSFYPYSHRYTPDLNWGFGLAAGGLILCILCSVLIAFSRVRHAPLTNQALANLGVNTMPLTTPPTIPMQPIMMGYGYPAPAYPYPYPSAPVMMAPVPAPAQGMPTSQIVAAQGMPASQAPTCFVMVQGQMVPVYKEMPPTMTNTPTAATDGTRQTEAPVDGQPSQKL